MKYSLLILILMTLSSPKQTYCQSITDLLPNSIEDWSPQGTDKVYTPENLYDYIDGGAELYLSYGMKEVASRIITRDDSEIRIEIFDMIEAKNAFGVFTHTRTHNEMQYGQGSQYFTGAQIFWKDNYFIAITANDDNESIQSAIELIANEIDSNILSEGEIPTIINLLPDDELEPDGYLYFHHYIWLNSFYYIANDNFLNLNTTTDAVLAKYGAKDHRRYLLIVKYPDNESAAKANNSFRELLQETNNLVERIEDKSWLGATYIQKYLVAVFNADTQESALNLIKKAETKITKP